MLDSIEISNFKRIQGAPLILKDLAQVNYLVGENGSGKSSVLEGVFEKPFTNFASAKINNNTINFAHFKRCYFRNFRNEDLSYLEEFVQNQLNLEYSKEQLQNEATGLNQDDYSGLIRDRQIPQFNQFIDLKNAQKNLLTFNKFQKDNNPNITLLEFDYQKKPITSAVFISDEADKQSYIEFLNKYFFQENNIKDISKNVLNDEVQVIHTDFAKTFLKDFASGYQNLFTIYHTIKGYFNNHSPQFKLLLIEEPETGLHPNFQKLLPEIFKDFTEEYFVKFIISTHSPFIISAAGDFKDSQKVYLIKEGQTVDLAKRKGLGSKGYGGDRALAVSAEMLGTGLEDLSKSVKVNEDLPKYNVIYCEGNDAEIYTTIFPKDNSGRINVFIGVGSALDVRNNYFIGRESCKLSFGKDVKVSFLVDCSCGTDTGFDIGENEKGNIIYIKTGKIKVKFTDEERQQFIDYYKKCDFEPRMLHRKEIENYLFDPKILKLALDRNLESNKINQQNFDNWSKLDCINGEVKDKVQSDHKLNMELAKLITPETDVYKELYSAIFRE